MIQIFFAWGDSGIFLLVIVNKLLKILDALLLDTFVDMTHAAAVWLCSLVHIYLWLHTYQYSAEFRWVFVD